MLKIQFFELLTCVLTNSTLSVNDDFHWPDLKLYEFCLQSALHVFVIGLRPGVRRYEYTTISPLIFSSLSRGFSAKSSFLHNLFDCSNSVVDSKLTYRRRRKKYVFTSACLFLYLSAKY